MPLVEVALSLGVKAKQEDGATWIWAPAKGRYWTPAEMKSWIDDGVQPNMSGVLLNALQAHVEEIRHCRYWMDPALDRRVAAQMRWDARKDTVKRRWATLRPSRQLFLEEQVGEFVDWAINFRLEQLNYGLHQYWGWGALTDYGIAVLDISNDMLMDLIQPPTETNVGPPYHRLRPTRKRQYVLDYPTLLSTQSTLDWRDVTKHVLPATLDPAWKDMMAWKSTDIDTIMMPVQDETGEIVNG